MTMHNTGPTFRPAAPNRQRGFSLMESLVAVLVFSFGAIGATGMQIMATQAHFEAAQRTQAVYFATDLMERMLNNPNALDSYDSPDDTDWTIRGSGSVQNEPTPDCATAQCTPAEQAAHDLWSWEQALDGNAITAENGAAVAGMVSPTGCIRQSDGGQVEVAIAWRGRSSMTDTATAPGCTPAEPDEDSGEPRYGANDEYRRVLHLRTYIADLTQS